MTPALTTVHQPIRALGGAAAERLIALAQGHEVADRQTVLPVTLSIRDSCGAAPSRARHPAAEGGGATQRLE